MATLQWQVMKNPAHVVSDHSSKCCSFFLACEKLISERFQNNGDININSAQQIVDKGFRIEEKKS